MKNFLKTAKLYIWKFVTAMITDTKPDGQVAVSLGRVCFLVSLGFLVATWLKSLDGQQPDMAPGLMEVFFTLSGYVFGTKVVEGVKLKFSDKGKVEKVG